MPASPPDPAEDVRRLAALRAIELIGAAPMREFEALAELAARLIGTPMAALTVIDAAKQRVVAGFGVAPGSMPRGDSFCDHAIRAPRMMVVPDTHDDVRFVDNILVTEAPHLRFYAGMPIRARAGDDRVPIGALCVLDHAPRKIDADQRAALTRLAHIAEALIDARAAAQEALELARQTHDQAVVLARQDRIFRQAERIAMIGAWHFDPESGTVEWSEGVRRIHGVGADYCPSLATALDFYPPAARAVVSDALAQAIETGEPFDYEVDFDTARGERRRVRGMGEVEREDGRAVAVTGVFQDVSARYLLEQDLRRSAHVDALTGIANRAAFDHRLEALVARAGSGKAPLVLVLVDLDGFKGVNDTLGHVAGDDVLRAHGQRLRSEWLTDSFPARLGGDEFALLLEGAATRDVPARIARLLDLFARPIEVAGRSVTVPGTVGWAAFEPGMTGPRDLIHAADTALYEAKRERKGSARAVRA